MPTRFGIRSVAILLVAGFMAGTMAIGVADAAEKPVKKKGKQEGAKAKSEPKYDEMVTVPAGKFIFGVPGATSTIDIPAFSIDKYEVTNALYAKFKPDYKFPADKANYPATELSWFEADAYCKAQGKRIPTEEEWEKAARGADGRIYPWGNEADEPDKCANVSEVGVGEPMAVGQFEKGKSPFGVMDMGGNVWEWTASYFKDDQRYAVLRGGSYFEDCSFSKTFSTIRSIPDDRKGYVGFRCVKDIK